MDYVGCPFKISKLMTSTFVNVSVDVDLLKKLGD
jgi:hypothetical protein